MEIERKFLVADDSRLSEAESRRIEQGYLAITEDGTEVRLRRRDGDRVLTIKHGSGRDRIEEELEVSDRQFDSLWPLTDGRRIEKVRHLVPEDDLTFEVDVFGGSLEGLVLAEVEFGSDRDADSFEPPAWLGEEVTGDERYLNENLARRGLPD
jgi:CYTH domain-containing protein